MKTKKNLQEKKKVTTKNQNKMMITMTKMKIKNLKSMILMTMGTNNILEVKKKQKKLI